MGGPHPFFEGKALGTRLLSRTSRGALGEGRKRKIFKFMRRECKLSFPFSLPQEPQENLLMTVKRTRYLTHTLFLTLFLCVLHLIKFGRDITSSEMTIGRLDQLPSYRERSPNLGTKYPKPAARKRRR